MSPLPDPEYPTPLTVRMSKPVSVTKLVTERVAGVMIPKVQDSPLPWFPVGLLSVMHVPLLITCHLTPVGEHTRLNRTEATCSACTQSLNLSTAQTLGKSVKPANRGHTSRK